jgi:hypothetical protein
MPPELAVDSEGDWAQPGDVPEDKAALSAAHGKLLL